MTGTMRSTQVVRNPETLEAVALVEGSEVPDWAADLVHPDDIEGSKASTKKSASSKSGK